MSSAKRRINSTGRKRIAQDNIDLQLLSSAPGDAAKARLSLKLDGLELPPSAAVIVEAYHKSSAVRFDCGTVGAPQIPELLSLNEIDRAGAALFRVKVVDREDRLGKILASAERIRPRSDADDKGRRSIFPVRHDDLGPEIWQVDIDDDAGPVLLLNNRVPNLLHRIYDNPLIGGILLPAAFRAVLEHLVDNSAEDEEEGTGWKADWFTYCKEKLGLADDPSELDPEGRAEWIADAVRGFCTNIGFVARARELLKEHSRD